MGGSLLIVMHLYLFCIVLIQIKTFGNRKHQPCSFQTSSSECYGHLPAGGPAGGPAAIEVYSDQENAWSVVKQTHIPPNYLGAVEIDGRVYFIVNSFPVDSGVILPPGEAYPAILDEWRQLRNISEKAVLCYVTIRKENLTTENE